MVFEVRPGISTPERPGPMTGGGGPIAKDPESVLGQPLARAASLHGAVGGFDKPGGRA
jgi:hypothetical protein